MIKKVFLNALKAIPALLLLGLGVWLTLGIFFLFLFSGCTKPAHPEWNSLPVPAGQMYAKTRSFMFHRGGEINGKKRHNYGKAI